MWIAVVNGPDGPPTRTLPPCSAIAIRPSGKVATVVGLLALDTSVSVNPAIGAASAVPEESIASTVEMRPSATSELTRRRIHGTVAPVVRGATSPHVTRWSHPLGLFPLSDTRRNAMIAG